jgi:very-short-patch-repair endonuclease
MNNFETKWLMLKLKIEHNCDLCFEYKFHPTRRFRFDAAIPEKRIAIEFDGGCYVQGRHTRGQGYINDMDKYNEATKFGWKLLRYPSHKLDVRKIFIDIEEIIKNEKNG